MARVAVVLAEGFEEIELTTVVDVLRRAGAEVTLAGLAGRGACPGSRGIVITPDAAWADVADHAWDALVLPGGLGGAERMLGHEGLLATLVRRVEREELVAAICAAPMVLDKAGVLTEGGWTCYPSLTDRVRTPGRRVDNVVDAGAVVTSQGPGTAMTFALHLVDRLIGPDVRDRVARELLASAL